MEALIRSLPDLHPLGLLSPPWREDAFPLTREDLELTYLGRNAVWRAVRRLGLEGGEVIAPAYHHGVEISALWAAGARVRFARVDAAMRLDIEHAETLVGPRTRALYVIHYAGFPQPMGPLRELARRHGLRLIEDCALALFSHDGERPLGTSGDAAIFCFYKTVPVPHGGALLLGAPHVSRVIAGLEPPPLLPALSRLTGSALLGLERGMGAPGRAVRVALKGATGALRRRAEALDVPVGTQVFDPAAVHLGMSPLAERVVRAADARDIVRRRRGNWLMLHRRLAELGRSPWKALPQGVCPLFYALRVEDKDRALALMHARGIEAVDFWRHGHDSVERGRFPEVERLRREVVELPCHQDLGPEDLERVVRAARDAVGGASRRREVSA
ncbi:DegT/DnrJ/EryC1/StrS family aminotransferase [Myxococcaceae bacterium GXIMD 01537]